MSYIATTITTLAYEALMLFLLENHFSLEILVIVKFCNINDLQWPTCWCLHFPIKSFSFAPAVRYYPRCNLHLLCCPVGKVDVLAAHTAIQAAQMAQDGQYSRARENIMKNQRVAWRHTR